MKKVFSFILLLIYISFVSCSDNKDKIEDIINEFKDNDKREIFSGLIVFKIRGLLDVHFYWKGGRVDKMLKAEDFYEDNFSIDIVYNEGNDKSLKNEILQRFKKSMRTFLSLNIMGVSGSLDNKQTEFFIDGEEVLLYFDSPELLSEYIEKDRSFIQEKSIRSLDKKWTVYDLKNPLDKD